MSSHQLNSKHKGLLLLFKTNLRHWTVSSCFLAPVAVDDKDGNGLKLEKNWANLVQVLMLKSQQQQQQKLLWLPLPDKFI